MKYSVDIITFCYNEMTILPWVVDYWKRIARHVYIFDDGSTDGSKEFLDKLDFVTVIDMSFLTENKLNDRILIWAKNNLFKMLRSDFSIICDMDECLYFSDLESTLDLLRVSEYKGIRPLYCNMICEHIPEYKEGMLFHEYNELCCSGNSKCLLIDNLKVKEIGYLPGAHVIRGIQNKEIWNCTDAWCFHLRYLSADYLVKRKNACGSRMSRDNINHGWAVHHLYNDNKAVQEYNKYLSESVPWKTVKSITYEN